MSKITRPTFTGVFPRKRLFGLLDRMRKQPVIWISGPPGSGKTTLISSYIENRKIPCLWYQIDEGDSDPATFFYYLGQAAKIASPPKRKPLPLLTPEYLQDVPTFTYRYFEELYSRLNPPTLPFFKGGSKEGVKSKIPPLVKGGTGGFVLVFDNYHELPVDSLLHEIILNGLSRIPEDINMIFISRSEPPAAMIRLRANNLMNVLGWEELRLTLAESVGLVRLRAKQTQSKETIKHLHNMTRGWAAGLVLMLESVRRGIEPKILGNLTPEEIFDYFGKEIFDKTDKGIQEFFLKTAFLPKMTGKMAQELTDLSSAGSILSTQNRNNYFTEKRFQKESIYQYHPLFRKFLLSRAKKIFATETLSLLYSRAAKLLEESGQAESAVSLLQEAGDWDGMVGLITKHAPSLLAQGRNRPLQEWLESLPREILENNPWLLYWMGSCRLPFDPSFARSCFEKAFEKFRTEEDTAGLFLAWSGVVQSILSGFEDFKPLDQWISTLDELMHDFKTFPSEQIRAAVAFNMFHALVRRQPHHPEIEDWAQETLSSVEGHENASVKIQALIPLALYRMYIGDTQKTLLAIHQIRQLSESPDAPPLVLLSARFAEAMYYSVSAGSYEKCLKAVSDALELAQTTGIHRLDHMVLGQGVVSALSAGDHKAAEELLDKMAFPLRSFKPWEACFYHLLKTRANLLKGDPRQASLHAEMALKLSEDAGSPVSSVRCHLAKAHVMHELGKAHEAGDHLTHALAISQQIKGKNTEFYALLAEALFALDQGKRSSALIPLQKALAIGKKEGYFITLIDRPFAMANLCVTALEAEIEVDYVQELVRRRNLIPDQPPFHLQNWPWSLKIYTLGRFELLKDDKPIRFSRKVQQKPLALLKALIAFGGKEVREDQIEDAFWPDADGDIAHHSFEMTLHRLRKLIGHENAIQYREGRVTLNPGYCWVDVWAFERILGGVDGKQREGLIETAVLSTQKAIELYRGPFLAGEVEKSWMVSIRERLRRKFLRNVSWLANYWEQSENWEKAVECYERGLEVDDLAEELYRHLMICYQRLGRKSEALSVYNRCKKNLSAALGIEPSPETKSLYQKILSENR